MMIKDTNFSKLGREAKLSERVGKEIESRIVAGKLRPNERLPAERNLAEQFGVSRTVIREAVKGLAARGMVAVSHGRAGTTIRLPTHDTLSDLMSYYLRNGELHTDYRDLAEVRQLLEVAIAGFAAERRNAADIRALAENLAEMQAAFDDRDRFVDIDLDFHILIARATHNRLFALLLDSVNDLMVDVRRKAYIVHGAPANTFAQHQAIFAAIKDGDDDEARAAMLRHIKRGRQVLQKALCLQAQLEIQP